ncbi:hypothetical protein GQ54DRAFT_299161, partial [Martensiomyces pterosporus]
MFTWGLTVCNSLVRACLFGPDRVLSSEDIDVATPDGRRVLVRLLVNLCLCEESRRGCIPTIQHHEGADGRYWTIRCNRINSSGEQEPEMATFYSRGPTMAADRNFGRHTRGFPAAERLKDIDIPTLFAKIAWHSVERGAAGEQRSELLHLSRIRKEFENSTDPDLHVPLLQAGGPVAVSTDDSWQDMTTDAIYGPVISQAYGERQDSVVDADEDTEHACIPHRQLVVAVMSPCGETLDSVRSADELIVVLADAMRAHGEILRRCNLLHRDISTNNILVIRSPLDGTVHGALIDFDCAISVGVDRKARPERTGTLPFMSVLNLEANWLERTELDDWESLLYLVCWLATFGINKEDRKSVRSEGKDPEDLCIYGWRHGSISSIR